MSTGKYIFFGVSLIIVLAFGVAVGKYALNESESNLKASEKTSRVNTQQNITESRENGTRGLRPLVV